MTKTKEGLNEIGYVNTQSNRAAERDAEFFQYMFRDAKVRLIVLFF